MKTLGKILILIVLIAGIISIIHFFTDDSDSRIKELKAQNELQKKTIYTHIISIEVLTKKGKKSQRSYKKLKAEFDDHKKIKPPETIRTLTKEKIIKEYEKVYYYLDRSLNEFSIAVDNGIDIEKKLKELFPVVIDHIDTSEKIIDILSDNRIKVYSLFQYQSLASEDHLSLEVFAIKRIYKNLFLRVSYKLFYYLKLESGFSFGLQLQIL